MSGTAGNNNSHDFTRGSDTLTMRIDRDTEVDDSLGVYPIIIGDSLCSITGLGGQFSFAANLDDGYQIIMHKYSDIDTSSCNFIVGIEDDSKESNTFIIYPNPSKGEFVIRASGFNNSTVQVIVRDMNGRILKNEFINNATNTFQKTFDLNGSAKGIYFISIQDGKSLINRKLILQ